MDATSGPRVWEGMARGYRDEYDVFKHSPGLYGAGGERGRTPKEIEADRAWFKDVRALRETSKAILVSIKGLEHWIPKSQIDDDSEVYKLGDEGWLVLSGWITEEKGLRNDADK